MDVEKENQGEFNQNSKARLNYSKVHAPDHHSILRKNITNKSRKTPFNMEERGENKVDFFSKDMRKLVRIVILENSRCPFKRGFMNSKIKMEFSLHRIQQVS